MQYNLKNKKILITGASGGIGRALCKKFIENGGILICTSSNLDKIQELKSEFGSNNFYYQLDLSHISKIRENVKLIIEEHKDINVLINNAGISLSTKDLYDKESFNKTLDVNFLSTLNFLNPCQETSSWALIISRLSIISPMRVRK